MNAAPVFAAMLLGPLVAISPLIASPKADSPAIAATPVERWSQLADTVFQRATPEQGFPTSSVTAIAQDGDGFLWIGTQNGLLRWDGYRVRRYTAEPGAAGHLRDNFIQALHADGLGRLWIGTSTAGLASYDRDTDSIISYPVNVGAISDVSVKSIEDDGARGVWVATSGGVDHLKADGTFAHVRHDAADPASLPDNQIGGLMRDRQGGLWIGTSSGLVRRDPDTGALQRVVLAAHDGKQPQAERLLQDSRGKIWIGTATGASVYDPFTGLVTPLHDASGALQLETEDVYQITEARPGEIWLGTFGDGIVVVDAATLQMHRIHHDALVPVSLPNDTVWSLFRDRSGLLWVGTGAGLSHADPSRRAFLSVFGADGRQRGLSDADVISVLATPNGRVWLGLGSNGIDVVDPAGATAGRVAQIRPDPLTPDTALPREHVLAMAGSGDVFVGSVRGLYRADAAAHGVTRIAVPEFKTGDSADALAYDNGSLWLGNWSGTAWHLDVQSGAATPTLIAKSSDRLTDTRVIAMARAPNDGWWIGTGDGVNRLDGKLAVVERILPDASDPHGLIGGYVTSLLTDNRGRLWIGTLGGISVLERRDARGRAQFHSIGAAAGLQGVAMLLKDAYGNVWASSDDGLALIDPDTFAVTRFGRADGLAFTSYFSGSGAVTSQGELLFGAVGGLTVVRPQLRSSWDYRPPVLVTEVRVGGRNVAIAPFNDDASKTTLTIPADANNFSVEFSALDFSAPNRNRYAYRLDGYDKEWIETDATRRFAAYTNLPPGDYVLHLRGSNRDGAWTERTLALPIRVMPTMFQSLWFRLLLVAIGVSSVFGIVRARTALLRHRQRELEHSVAERTLQLWEATRALEAKSQALEEASLTDALTGLRNRRFLAQHIDADTALAIRHHEQRALHPDRTSGDAGLVFYLIDIDHFKRVNDEHGHAAGDTLLVQLCERLRAVFRESDDLVRWGGEEFLIVTRETTRDLAADLAERVRRAVGDEPFALPDGQLLPKTCSIGFACFPPITTQPRAVSWEETVELADIALYSAKNAGRDCWVGIRANDGVAADGFIARFKAHPQELIDGGLIDVLSNRKPTPSVKSG